jgi:hypothetical protein
LSISTRTSPSVVQTSSTNSDYSTVGKHLDNGYTAKIDLHNHNSNSLLKQSPQTHFLQDMVAGGGEDTQVNAQSEARISRNDWEVIHQISDHKFRRLLQFVVDVLIDHPIFRNITTDDSHIIQRLYGGFNHIVIMAVIQSNHIEQFVVRVPAIGTAARWQDGDAHNMRCSVALMMYLRHEMGIPVPEVLTFEDTLNSWVNAPYILVK